mgnify:FL=1
MSRKARPSSRLLQALKPFEPTVWYFLLATSLSLLGIFYLAMKTSEQNFDTEFKGFIWLVVKVKIIFLNKV